MADSFPNIPVLFSAGSWYVKNKLRIPLHRQCVSEIICDCGSFSVFRRFGKFPYTWEQYYSWVKTINPKWFATWDKPGDPISTQKYIEKYSKYGGVPTCQGIEPCDYRAHTKDLKDFNFIAVGNLVRPGIDRRAILDEILMEVPQAKLHIWGLSLHKLIAGGELPSNVVSIDSSSWNGRWGKGIEEYKQNQGKYTQRMYAIKVMIPRYLDKWKQWRSSKGYEDIV